MGAKTYVAPPQCGSCGELSSAGDVMPVAEAQQCGAQALGEKLVIQVSGMIPAPRGSGLVLKSLGKAQPRSFRVWFAASDWDLGRGKPIASTTSHHEVGRFDILE
ncbi:hypothetical protein S40285_10299 [Stachybotrys chlorohalonatus IBT 40285]|uniref:Uncharacterized protein n=1 Tax=Stachybotrys chlorohalonatus (strain IBT 40285) TaxID=1283841 RepID=A0A084QNW2_STAC4|nr:hypothetical protein S40285_10299 [Stachybotrys chlorohalonata IBT 40285]